MGAGKGKSRRANARLKDERMPLENLSNIIHHDLLGKNRETEYIYESEIMDENKYIFKEKYNDIIKSNGPLRNGMVFDELDVGSLATEEMRQALAAAAQQEEERRARMEELEEELRTVRRTTF
jgi:hypothetical protein